VWEGVNRMTLLAPDFIELSGVFSIRSLCEVLVWPSVWAMLLSSTVALSPVPRHSVRGLRPGSTDEDISEVDKFHELVLVLCLPKGRDQRGVFANHPPNCDRSVHSM
jgi:hypothetical protein